MNDTSAINALSTIITHAAAPAFLLRAVASFLSILLARVELLMGRIRLLMHDDEQEQRKAYPDKDVKSIRRRATLLHWAVFSALVAAIGAVLLVIMAFVYGLLNQSHVYIMAIFFIITLLFMAIALCIFVAEMSLASIDYKRSQ